MFWAIMNWTELNNFMNPKLAVLRPVLAAAAIWRAHCVQCAEQEIIVTPHKLWREFRKQERLWTYHNLSIVGIFLVKSKLITLGIRTAKFEDEE